MIEESLDSDLLNLKNTIENFSTKEAQNQVNSQIPNLKCSVMKCLSKIIKIYLNLIFL